MTVDPVAVKVALVVALLGEACDASEDPARPEAERLAAARSVAAVEGAIDATPVLRQRIDGTLLRRMRRIAQLGHRLR